MNRKQRSQAAKEFKRRLVSSQKNVLFEDSICNSKRTDDVFWNGPIAGSKLQRVGAILFAFVLFGSSYSVIAIGRAPLFYLVGLAGMAAASRIAFMAIRNKRKS